MVTAERNRMIEQQINREIYLGRKYGGMGKNVSIQNTVQLNKVRGKTSKVAYVYDCKRQKKFWKN